MVKHLAGVKGDMEQTNKNKILAGIIIIAAIVLIAVAASMFDSDKGQGKLGDDSVSLSSSAQDDADTDQLAPVTGISYKDGTYVVSDTYPSPGGIEDIKVTVTIANNVVSDAEVV